MFLLAAAIGPSLFISTDATVLIIVLLVAYELTEPKDRGRARRLFALCFAASSLLYVLAAAAR